MPVSMSLLGQVLQRLEAQAAKYRRMAESSADGKAEAYNEGVVEGIEEAIEVVRNAMNYAHYHQRLVDDQRLSEVLNALKERYQQALVASDDDAERAFYRGKLAGIQIALESL